MPKLVLVIITIVFLKFSLNAYKYLRIKHLSKLHTEWLAHKSEKFPYCVKETADLMKAANIPGINGCVNVTENAGYGHMRSYKVSLLDNLTSYSRSIAPGVISLFDETIGAYRKHALDAFNPFYWLDLIIFLPKHISQYLGIDISKHIGAKAVNLALTLIWWVIGITFIYFRPYINEFISSLIS